MSECESEQQELDQLLFDFNQIQEELNHKEAQQCLRQLVRNLDLTQQEQRGLEEDLKELTTILDRLEQNLLQIAVFGMVGQGKSSVLNALIGEQVFSTGPLHGVTQDLQLVDWPILGEDYPVKSLTFNQNNQTSVRLLDTPGIDEINGEQREKLATTIAQKVDLLLFVVAGDLNQVEYQALSHLRSFGKPLLLVFNKIDQYPTPDRLTIYNKIKDERVKELLSPEEILMVSASPLIYEQQEDLITGKIKVRKYRGEPAIEPLRLKILEVLQREGKSLMALNSSIFAHHLNKQLLARKELVRGELAEQLIRRTMATKALALALNPVTVFDLCSGAAIDVAMILNLSRIYGLKMGHQEAMALLQKISLAMGALGVTEVMTNFALSSLKGLVSLSLPMTGGLSFAGYVPVAIAQGTVGGFSSYTIGQVTKHYLIRGATWGEDSPKAVVKNILNSLDRESIMARLKSELASSLHYG